MKLINKTNRNFILLILVTLPIACLVLFSTLNYFLSEEVDEQLRVNEARIVEQLISNPTFITIAPIIEVSLVGDSVNLNSEIKDVYVFDPIQKEDEPFRELTSLKQINGKTYLIRVRQSTIEDEDFLIAIATSMSLLLVLIFGLLVFLNNRLSLKLWRPFYHNLEQLKSYSITENEDLELMDSKIDEFQDLQSSLISLTDKVKKDYGSLKEFTENASHEIQTPLSIVSITLDEVLQDEHSESTYKKLYSCYQSVQRLSKLNEKLLLLSKLDNDQFQDLQDVNINDLIADWIEELKPLINERKLKINASNEGAFIASIDSHLANMLIVNLLSNAIIHSIPTSTIVVQVYSDSFHISNRTEQYIDADSIFDRFKKGNTAKSSTGLGLSIVKKIIEVAKLEVEASLANDIFEISVRKPVNI